MPIVGYPHNFLRGLSDFWQRFFADADQLKALYDGSAVLMGQAYLDMLQNVLSLSLQDVSLFHKEYFYLVTIREDQAAFVKGDTTDHDRWAVALADGLVSFGRTLDNKVIEPTASLQLNNDFDMSNAAILFKQDPTDPAHDGVPLPGYARRGLDVAVGGQFDDTTRLSPATWPSYGVYKGDTLRLLDISTGSPVKQSKHSDHDIVLVRDKALYVSSATPFDKTGTTSYVILRQPDNFAVSLEALTFSPPTGIPASAPLAHTRVDQGSVRIYAKRGYDGQDVVEGVDYTVDYELGRVYKIANPTANPLNVDWQAASPDKADYTWRVEVWPNSGGSPPRYSTTGTVLAVGGTARVTQIALWASDARVDRRTLANNFGSLVGSSEPSSEAYRALLRGIFQLYILGPVLERIESALNVVLGFPVIRDDGEVFQSVDLSLPDVNRITTLRPSSDTLATYDYPKTTPLRTDVLAAAPGSLTFMAFEPLTEAVRVVDYVEDPTWWYEQVIPPELFSTADGASIPSPARRTASATLVQHIAAAEDGPRCGDPGLVCGADEEGVIPPPGHPVFRHRFAFVVMNRFLKFHTFLVQFNSAILTPTTVGNKFERSLAELNELVTNAKPAHTYAFVTPLTQFLDTMVMAETQVYQPQRYMGADPNAPELYPDVASLPAPLQPYEALGLFIHPTVTSPPGNDDKVQFGDQTPVAGGPWLAGDYFHYELISDTLTFATIGTPVSIGGTAVPPQRSRFVRVFVNGTIGGKHLVENVDYSLDYANQTITRLTAWDSTTGIVVTYVQVMIGNTADLALDVTTGDVPFSTGDVDPSNARAVYDPAAIDWLGNLIPVTNHRDLSLVERAVTIKLTPQFVENDMPIPNAGGIWGFGPSDIYTSGGSSGVARWNGTSWVDITVPGGDPNALFGIWGASNAAVWVVGGINRMYKTTDQGATWVAQTPPGPDTFLQSIWGISATDFWVGGNSGTIYHTTNGGASYTPYTISSGNISSIYGLAANRVFATCVGGVQVWDGVSWTFHALDAGANTDAVWVLGSEAWAVTDNGTMYHSADSGLTWLAETVEASTTSPSAAIFLYSVFGDGAGQVYAVGFENFSFATVVYIRTGTTWRQIFTPPGGPSFFIGNLWVDGATGHGAMVGGPGGYALVW